MTKYFTWSAAGTQEILPAPGAMKRYRVLSAPMSSNEATGSAILYNGPTPPSSGCDNVIDYVDNNRHSTDSPFVAPFLCAKNQAINLVTADNEGTTSGRGMIVYIEETA